MFGFAATVALRRHTIGHWALAVRVSVLLKKENETVAKLAEVAIGQIWSGRVSQRMVRLRVEEVVKPGHFAHKGQKTKVRLTNLRTNREIMRTPAFLRSKLAEGSLF